jgi:hypothetical protein
MHAIHCGSAVFPYQVLVKRPAKEALLGCMGQNLKKIKVFNIHSIQHENSQYEECVSMWGSLGSRHPVAH